MPKLSKCCLHIKGGNRALFTMCRLDMNNLGFDGFIPAAAFAIRDGMPDFKESYWCRDCVKAWLQAMAPSGVN